MVGIETFYGFVPNENFCTPSPPSSEILQKIGKKWKKFDWSKYFGVGGSEGWSLNPK